MISYVSANRYSWPDFLGQKWRTHGDYYEEAVKNGTEALESLVIAYQETGETLPEPTINKAA
ncbi:type II toxin-antitoxin system HicB family antitoxin [Moorena producens JHB]|uniref:Type II toxin-antitoxin system HicB family antitoxin n=1 Tax=Moorena producens (strain JHB) TaxID=1454205 RepID=A0A9Q9SUL3_MOOP1|nr:type II toxin-antitoxin system HicB family antitoxin [Moorena producens]WAN69937.1 type II toxin-antitoxin system HicB family antitoxin [Moorena producens JHB]